MNMATLFGKLTEYELELGILKEEGRGKRHIIALKTVARTATKNTSRKHDSKDDLDAENFDSHEFYGKEVFKISEIQK